MPQEFLRDVLRTGDGAERRHRRLSILPLSIAGHAIVLGAFLISPWAGAIDLPVIASPFQGHYMETVPPPAPPAPSTPAQPAPRPSAPIEAPSEIGEEAPIAPSRPVEGGLIDGPGVSTGAGVLSDLSVGSNVTPVLPPPPRARLRASSESAARFASRASSSTSRPSIQNSHARRGCKAPSRSKRSSMPRERSKACVSSSPYRCWMTRRSEQSGSGATRQPS